VVVLRHEQLRVVCVDLSAGGIAVLAPRAPRRLERVRLHAMIGEHPLIGEALVVRGRRTAHGHLWGMRFLNLDELTRANLRNHVQQLLAASARLRQAQLFTARIQQASAPRTEPGPPDGSAVPPGGGPAAATVSPAAQRRTQEYAHREVPFGRPPSQQPTLHGGLPGVGSDVYDPAAIDFGARPTQGIETRPAVSRGGGPAPAPGGAPPAPVFDPAVQHDADLLGDGPVGTPERAGAAGAVSPQLASPDGRRVLAQVKPKRISVPARSTPSALEEDRDVAQFLASVAADPRVRSLAAEAALEVPVDPSRNARATVIGRDPERARAGAPAQSFAPIPAPDFDEDCDTHQVRREIVDSGIGKSVDTVALRDPGEASAPTAAKPSPAPPPAVLDPTLIEGLDGLDTLHDVPGSSVSPLPTPPPSHAAAQVPGPRPRSGRSEAPAPPAPSLQEWENESRTPPPASLAPVTPMPAPAAAPSLSDWEAEHRTPVPVEPGDEFLPLESVTRANMTVESVLGPAGLEESTLDESLFGDIAEAAARDTGAGPRSYSAADLSRSILADDLSEEDEELFEDLEGAEIEDAAEDLPTRGGLERWSGPQDAVGLRVSAEAFESASGKDYSESGFTNAIDARAVGPRPNSAGTSPPGALAASVAGFAVMPPSYDVPGGSAPRPKPTSSDPPRGETVVASLEALEAFHRQQQQRMANVATSSLVPSFQVRGGDDADTSFFPPRPIAPPIPDLPDLPDLPVDGMATSAYPAAPTRIDGPRHPAVPAPGTIPTRGAPPTAAADPGARRAAASSGMSLPPARPELLPKAAKPPKVEPVPVAKRGPTNGKERQMTGRQVMIQDALARLRRRTDQDAGVNRPTQAAGGTQARTSRRRRRPMGLAEHQNPELLDLYQQALQEIDVDNKYK
jgi:hypothetical protein